MVKISKKLEKILEEGNIKYDIVEHRTTYTAEDRAATNAKNKIKPQEIVKTLVLKSDRNYVLALLSSNKDLDKTKFKKLINDQLQKRKKELARTDPKAAKKIKNYKKVDLAKESWMKKHIPGKIGAVPPFSNLLSLEMFVDKSLLKQKQLYFGCGEYELSIKMTPKNYEKLEKELVKGSFGKIRKR